MVKEKDSLELVHTHQLSKSKRCVVSQCKYAYVCAYITFIIAYKDSTTLTTYMNIYKNYMNFWKQQGKL